MAVVIPISTTGTDPAIIARLLNLETNEKLVEYFEVVTGARSGNQVTVPTDCTISLDRFGSSKDAILSTVDGNGIPTWTSPKDAGDVVITTTMAEHATAHQTN